MAGLYENIFFSIIAEKKWGHMTSENPKWPPMNPEIVISDDYKTFTKENKAFLKYTICRKFNFLSKNI